MSWIALPSRKNGQKDLFIPCSWTPLNSLTDYLWLRVVNVDMKNSFWFENSVIGAFLRPKLDSKSARPENLDFRPEKGVFTTEIQKELKNEIFWDKKKCVKILCHQVWYSLMINTFSVESFNLLNSNEKMTRNNSKKHKKKGGCYW